MQSFLLIAVCYILIINVTFCRKCNESFCRGKCYYKQKGFGYGFCNNDNNCVCAPMDIYIFDGVDRAVNGEYTQYSLNRSNVQRMIMRKNSRIEYVSSEFTVEESAEGNSEGKMEKNDN